MPTTKISQPTTHNSQLSRLPDWLNRLTTLHSKTIDLGLTRIKEVATNLSPPFAKGGREDLTDFSIPVITVAGTNGKGSTVAMLAAIYQAAGYRVATYTSPHLLDFRERLQIQNEMLDEATWCEAFAYIDAVRGEVSLTFFEFTTLAALWILQNKELDVIILEVGLGGRLDAVNIVDPTISVITTIDFDHMEYLGDTREAIGREKAGIFRANKPAVCGDFDTPDSVRETAAQLGTELFCQGKNFHHTQHEQQWTWQTQNLTLENLPVPALPLQNAATVLQVIHLLQAQLPVTRTAIDQGLRAAKLAGRMQWLKTHIPTVVDVAHNPHAARLLATQLAAVQPQPRHWYAVVGMLKDKDIAGTLKPLMPLIKAWYVGSLTGERGASAEQLHTILQQEQQAAQTFASPQEAYQKVLQAASEKDAIIVFGSFHTVAEVLQTK